MTSWRSYSGQMLKDVVWMSSSFRPLFLTAVTTASMAVADSSRASVTDGEVVSTPSRMSAISGARLISPVPVTQMPASADAVAYWGAEAWVAVPAVPAPPAARCVVTGAAGTLSTAEPTAEPATLETVGAV